MESLSVIHLIPSVRATSTRWRCPYVISRGFTRDCFFPRRVEKQISYPHIISRSKRSVYQDFQDFAKPLQLFPATQVTTYSGHFPEEIIYSLELDQSTSLYLVELCTSKDFGSCLRDLNAAVIICLIDVNGRSIMQRISVVSQENECIHFQRGNVDTATFKGQKLGKIAALWIGLESGSWRVAGVELKVINIPTSSPPSNAINQVSFSGLQYKFDADNILLGDGGFSVIELRPTAVTALSSPNPSPETPYSDPNPSKDGGMAEYAALKFSLLLYDSILVVAGSTALAGFSNEANAYSFLAGGAAGFLYLLLLQRSVDGLSAPLSSEEDDEGGMTWPSYGGFKGGLLIFVSVIFAVAVLSKDWMGGRSLGFSPSEIFAGVAGFLACRVAVVLAAFRPVRVNIKGNNMK